MAAEDHLHPQLFGGFGRPTQRSTTPPAQAASSGPGPGQLPMFMSAREIRAQYQPLDADRMGMHGSNEHTTWSSGGGDNPTARTYGQHRTRRTSGGSKLYISSGEVESDSSLWERKAEEAHEYGLHAELEEEGVQKPVSLGTQFGESGKPQVVGGHHRIAAMSDIDPDELMPVLHYKSFHQARDQGERAKKGRGGWKYT